MKVTAYRSRSARAPSSSNPATSPSRPTAPALVRLGDTVVLATACMQHERRCRATSCRSPSTTASTPTPPGGSRAASSSAKGAPTEKEIITSRLIDRPLRPLFPRRLHLRDAGHRPRALRRRRERPGHPGDQRRLDCAGALPDPVLPPDRRRARRARSTARSSSTRPTASATSPISTSSSSAPRTRS